MKQEPILGAIKESMDSLHTKVDDIQEGVIVLRDDVHLLKEDVHVLKEDVQILKENQHDIIEMVTFIKDNAVSREEHRKDIASLKSPSDRFRSWN